MWVLVFLVCIICLGMCLWLKCVFFLNKCRFLNVRVLFLLIVILRYNVNSKLLVKNLINFFINFYIWVCYMLWLIEGNEYLLLLLEIGWLFNVVYNGFLLWFKWRGLLFLVVLFLLLLFLFFLKWKIVCLI